MIKHSMERTIQEALSFDDVLVEPAHSKVLPKEVNLETVLTKKIQLNIPILSAAMDTVTEAAMAIRMAQHGGLGVIHRNFTIEKQAQEVKKVKKSESGMISDPITISPEEPVSRAIEIMRRHQISGIPVTVGTKLKGILTNRDLQFEKDMTQKVSQVMTKDKLITSHEGTTLEESKDLLHKHRIEKLLVVDQEGNLKGLITIRDIKKATEFPRACKDEKGRLRVAAAVGTGDSQMERAEALIAEDVDAIVVDTAHGHSQLVMDFVSKLKKKHSKIDVIAGNVATGLAAHALIDAGVDAIKVGIGPGSICTTRAFAEATCPPNLWIISWAP